MKRYFLISLCLLGVMGCAPSKSVKKYGLEFNMERERLGLRPIDADARLNSERENVYPAWTNPVRKVKGNPGVPHWLSKQLEIRDGLLLTEADTYSSGKIYDDPTEGKCEEELIIEYDFRKAKAGVNPWRCKIFWGPNSGVYTLQQATSILKGWGISRR